MKIRWIVWAVLMTLKASGAQSDYLTERPDYAGVWVNTFGKSYDLTEYTGFIAGEADRQRWKNFEPSPGVFDFSAFEATLTRCQNLDYYYYAEVWTGENAPSWIYAEGVPMVRTNRGSFPYYLDTDYSRYVSTFFKELAGFIAKLSPGKRSRIAFLQPGFGSTGDRQLYKSEPLDPQYEISSEQYLAFMQKMTIAWHDAFDAYPETRNMKYLWNIDDGDRAAEDLADVSDDLRGERLYARWMRENYNCQFRKQQFTTAIGYMAVNERDQDEQQRNHFYGISDPVRWAGNPEFVRGEHNDTKWAETPMALTALKWHYYWTAISSVDRGLDAWETKPDYLLQGDYNEAFSFSTRHAFSKKPDQSRFAFIALRDVLDYSNRDRFPEAQFGIANRQNTSRIDRILADYAVNGAKNDDTQAVVTLGQSAYLLRSTGLNDCVWNVIDRNYRRHMTQHDPNGTSVGRWRVGATDQPYGRFARAFESDRGKNVMYFSLNHGFIAAPPAAIKISITYWDHVAGSTWDLRYDAGTKNLKIAKSITGNGDGRWKTMTVTLTDAAFEGNGPNGSDLSLVNTDERDDVFHLIEVEKL